MNKLTRFFVAFLPMLMLGKIAFAKETNSPVVLEAVKNVLHTPVADKIDKDKLMTLIKPELYLDGLLHACMESVENHLEYSDKVNICSDFLKQVIFEHNRIFDNAAPHAGDQFHQVGDPRFYLKDKSYYMTTVVPSSYATYKVQGIFDKTDKLVCLLDCVDNVYYDYPDHYYEFDFGGFFCKPDTNSNIAFACEPKTADFQNREVYSLPDRFIIGYKQAGSDDTFNFNHKYLTSARVIETLQSRIDTYRNFNYDGRKILNTSADFADCKNFLNKRLTPKTYQYVPEQSSPYDSYVDHINDFNKTVSKAKEADTDVCSALSYTYDIIRYTEAEFDKYNNMISDFVSTSHFGDPATKNRIQYVITEMEVFRRQLDPGMEYSQSYESDDCTEYSVDEVVYDDVASYHNQTRYTVKCMLNNDYLPPMPIVYLFVVNSQKQMGDVQIDDMNYK